MALTAIAAAMSVAATKTKIMRLNALPAANSCCCPIVFLLFG
jgi:hypothetical protein